MGSALDLGHSHVLTSELWDVVDPGYITSMTIERGPDSGIYAMLRQAMVNNLKPQGDERARKDPYAALLSVP